MEEFMKRMFGTDGVRGIANRDLTPDLAYRLGVAGAMVLAGDTSHKPTILIGCDTRISCGMLEAALTAGICSAGADVFLCGVVPTPAVAYLTHKYKCEAGIMISASHNSYEYNGIKFFSGNGFKLPDDTEDEIEAMVHSYDESKFNRPLGGQIGQRIFLKEAAHEYEEHIKRRLSVDLSNLKIAIDCANGSASAIAPDLFKDLGATIFVTSNQPDGLNINRNCGSTSMGNLRDLIRREGCDIGLAFDGDADRLLAMDEYGITVDGDAILAIIGLDMKDTKELNSDTIVVTVMSNLGLDIMAKEQGLSLEKTKVGDRYVLEKMLAGGFNLGGEQSGHVILLDHSTTGDGILTALALLRVLVRRKKPLSKIANVISVFPQVLKPARIPDDKKHKALEDKDLIAVIKKYEKTLDGRGRILVRASGTEPMIRVMIEGEDLTEINAMAEHLVELIVARYGA
jgi:phosphoglucosamine mutase